MALKSILKKVGNGIRKAGRFVKNKVNPFVGRLAKPILHGVSMLPGKLGYIGKLGSALTGMAESIVDKVPNENVRDKVRNWIDNEARLGRTSIDKHKDGSERVIDTIKNVKNRYQNEVKPLIKSIISSKSS